MSPPSFSASARTRLNFAPLVREYSHPTRYEQRYSPPDMVKSRYARLKGRRGHKKAIVAVGHSILVIAYHVLTRRQPYTDLGTDYLVLRDRTAYTARLVRQLERLGHKVTLELLPQTT